MLAFCFPVDSYTGRIRFGTRDVKSMRGDWNKTGRGTLSRRYHNNAFAYLLYNEKILQN